MSRGKVGAFFFGLFAGGISTWFQPYNEIEIFGIDYRIVMAMAALILAFLYKLWFDAGTVNTGLFLSYGIITALFLRIIADVIVDPTDHNLWPLEIAIFVVIAFPSALIGAYLGELVQWVRKK
ncbi:hypothetical protein [Salinimicrobium soli]|uniref:hypothetical protein n=1 Tax=Salinimicrobium soli TaxID=1254399 RepID=UPI003AAE102A